MSTLTQRGQIFLSIAFVLGIFAMLAIAGAIETQDLPTCEDYQASQNWQAAWEKNCPFQDSNGNYLYEWMPNN